MVQQKNIRVSTPSASDLDLELRFVSAPTAEKHGTAVLFLHFYGGSAATYDPALEQLASLKPDSNAVAVSYAGTGRTEAPSDDRPEMHSIEPRAQQLLALLKSDEGRALVRSKRLVICAHSASAKVSYVLLSLLAADEALDLQVVGLVLLGPAPVGPLVLPPELQEQSLRAYVDHESARWTLRNVLSERELELGVLEQLARDCAEMSPGAKSGWLRFGMRFECGGYLAAVGKRWPGLVVRVLVGERDKVETVEKVMGQTVAPLREAGFRVESEVVEGCGHLLPVEATDSVARAVAALL